jgi:cytidylate kinase
MANEKAQDIIAIDGPSGTGKSTTAKMVAKELGWTYLDTGAMYRAVAYLMENGEWKMENLSFDQNNEILIDGVNRENEIRDPKVSAVVSKYSAMPNIREALTAQQREIGSKQPCVLDGRDIGTVVFPNAKHKFFLTADYKTRSERRLAELQAAGKASSETLESVEKNLRERDELDSKREFAPLAKAKDAIEIDTSHITIQQQVQRVLQSVGEAARCKHPQNTTPKVT